MQEQKAFLLLSGEVPKEFPDLSIYQIVCATDSAYLTLKKNNITPHFISGDFDSLSEIPENIEVIKTPNQNFTDFYKALEILHERGFSTIDVYGASGKQQDHFLDNLSTAIQWKKKLRLRFVDNYGEYFLADKSTIIKNCKNKIVSLIPFNTVSNITTEGLKYSLNKEDLQLGKRMGTRNIAIKNNVKVNYEKGNLFIFINNR